MADAILARAQKSPGWNELDPRMQSRLLALFRASGGRVYLGGGARSTKAQEQMFRSRYRPDPKGTIVWNGQRWKHVSGAAAAPPGRSMHEVGLAADLAGDLKWMNAHAAEFGLKHFAGVNNEPWHVQPAELPNSRSQFDRQMGGVWSGGANEPGPPVFPSSRSPYPAAGGTADDPYNWKGIAAGIAAGRINPDGTIPPNIATFAASTSTAVPEAKAPAMNAPEERSAFDAYLKSVGPNQAAQIIAELKQGRSLEEVSQYMAGSTPEVNRYINFLSSLDTPAQNAEKNMLAAPDAQGSQEMTDLLRTLGVSYSNAPNPTPALLAFLRGVGLNMSTAEDVKRRALDRIGAATSDAMADIDRTAGRTKQNVTADLIRRNILSSGESNTRYARHAEDVAEQKSDVTRTAANSNEDVNQTYEQALSLSRQQALDRVISAEQDQATQKASSAAQEDAYRRTQAAAEEANRQSLAAQQESNRQQIDAIQRYAAQGVAV